MQINKLLCIYIALKQPIKRREKTISPYSCVPSIVKGGKIKTRTEANLSNLPGYVVLGIEKMLKSKRETILCLKDIAINKCIDYKRYILLVNPDLEKEELAWLDNHKQCCDALLEDIYKKWVKKDTFFFNSKLFV